MDRPRSSRKSLQSHETYTDLNTTPKIPQVAQARKVNISYKKRSEASGKSQTKRTIKIPQSEKFSDTQLGNTSPEATSDHENQIDDTTHKDEDSATNSVQNKNANNKQDWLTILSIKRKSQEQPTNIENTEKIRKMNECTATIEPEDSREIQNKMVIIPRAGYEINCKISKAAFTYTGHKCQITQGAANTEIEKGIVACCRFCNHNLVYQGPSKGGTSNLTRHLKSVHPKELAEIEGSIAKGTQCEQKCLKSWMKGKSSKAYNSNDPIQRKFNKSLLIAIAKDKLPFNIVNGSGFKNMIQTLDPSIHVPSRTTVQRNFKKEYNAKVLPGTKKLMGSIQKGIISLDGWKSRRKDGIIGMKIHFIDDNWVLRKRTIAIKELNVSQTGDAIKQCYDEVITEFGLNEKISYVMTDSGANMVKAFKPPNPIAKTQLELNAESYSSTDEDGNIDEEEFEDITIYCDSDSENESNCADDVEIDVEASVIFNEQLNVSLQDTMVHLRCSAHQLQLAINKSLEDPDASEFLAYVNTVIKYFTNNTTLLAKLRTLAGKGLLKKAETRWNYWVDALRRLSQDVVFDSAKQLLELAHKKTTKIDRNSLPRKLTKLDHKKIKEMIALLQPFADLTDTLQADGVTSSILIPSLVSKLKLLHSVEDRFFSNLKTQIAEQIKIRFETVVSNPVYVVASSLDPRIRLNAFKLKDTYGLPIPSFSEAKVICEAHLQVKVTDRTGTLPQRDDTQHGVNFLDIINKEADQIESENLSRSELDIYLSEPNIPSTDDILKYWQRMENVYPTLATAAKLYLAIPATSGSVERLFSELSAIGRAHRASVMPQQLEEQIMYSEYMDSDCPKQQ